MRRSGACADVVLVCDRWFVQCGRRDHRGGARAITQHLIKHGHRRIAFIGDDPAIFSAEERFLGFAEAMSDADLTINPRWVDRAFSNPGRVVATVKRLLETYPEPSAPTALVAGQNFITIGAVQALHDLGLQHEVALVGFDNVDLASVVEPGITVMPQSPRELGKRAAQLLFERLAGNAEPPVLEISDDKIIVRGSGEVAPT